MYSIIDIDRRPIARCLAVSRPRVQMQAENDSRFVTRFQCLVSNGGCHV